MKRIQPAAKGFIVHEGKFLAMHKTIAPHQYYELPGGRIEFGETFEEALHREIKEETSLEIQVEMLLDTWNAINEEHQIIGVIYLCTIQSGTVTLSEEHDDYVWLPLTEDSLTVMHRVYKERMMLWEMDSFL